VAGDHVLWSDLRECPADTSLGPDGMIFELHHAHSTVLTVPDLAFDREQYLTEVRRAITDRVWESDRWRTAVLLVEYLGHAISAKPGRTYGDFRCFAEPAGGDDPRFLVTRWNDLVPAQGVVVALAAAPGTPEQHAQSMTDALMATPGQDWPVVERMEQPRP
jgi:hypothetical protein